MSYRYTRPPMSHQLVAMKRIFRRKRQLVWFDPGEGKTKVALDFIGTMLDHKKIQRALVVAPPTAIFGVWLEQIELDCPWIHYSILSPDTDCDWSASVILTSYSYFIDRRKKKRSKRDGRVLTDKLGHDKMFRDKEKLNRLIEWEPQVVVLDESHKIKNRQSRSAKSAHKLARVCEYMILLSGSPKGNKKVLDLWSQFEALEPGLLGSYQEFESEYCIKGGAGGHEIIKFRGLNRLAPILAPYITRRKAEGLPPMNEIVYRIDLPPKARMMYLKMEKEFVIALDKQMNLLEDMTDEEKFDRAIHASNVLASYMKIRQIAGGFIHDTEKNEDIPVHNVKLEAVEEICEELKAADICRVVIFATFRWELEQIRKVLATKWTTYTIHGGVPMAQRKLALEMFKNDGGAMIIQNSIGSESLNLQSANYAIIYSKGFSIIEWQQMKKRIHRKGQDKPCFYYLLRAKGTIDVRIYRILREGVAAHEEFAQMIEEVRNE